MRAKAGRRGAGSGCGRTRESPSPARRGEGDEPGSWDPPGSERERERAPGWAIKEETGRMLGWAVGREKGKEKRRGFGLGRKPKEKRKGFSIFRLESNKFSLNSNSNEFEFKLSNNNKTMQFSMSATQIEQTYLNFEKQPIYIFFYTKFHVKK